MTDDKKELAAVAPAVAARLRGELELEATTLEGEGEFEFEPEPPVVVAAAAVGARGGTLIDVKSRVLAFSRAGGSRSRNEMREPRLFFCK